MRLWSLHPSLLDRQGLVACWREALLAQAVLLGRTRGYTAHPQLERFKDHDHPKVAVGAYLVGIHDEATARGYRFDASRIVHRPAAEPISGGIQIDRITVTTGQLEYERSHLQAKLSQRSPEFLVKNTAMCEAAEESIPMHPLFYTVPGPIEPWERT